MRLKAYFRFCTHSTYNAVMDSREVIRRLTWDGWVLTHVSSRHQHFRHPKKPATITMMCDRTALPDRLVLEVFQLAGLDTEGIL
ncbi:MAG: type II toxin-antitoxin system HicA family toxin [Chromatiales bacterium]|nr:type II toxin-antitoxin system HicA family toxin [Chromatiales bacterium]